MAALMHASWNAILKSDQSDRLATFGVIMTTGTVMGLVRRAVPAVDRAGSVEIPRELGTDPRPLLHVPAKSLFLRRFEPHLSDRARARAAPGGAGVGPLHRRASAGAGHRRRPVAELRPDHARHAVAQCRAAAGQPAWFGHPVRRADGLHHRRLHHRRRVGRAQRRSDLPASPVLHRLAVCCGRTVAAGAGDRIAARHRVDASPAHLVARRDRRRHRQCRLRHCDLCACPGADGAHRGVA